MVAADIEGPRTIASRLADRMIRYVDGWVIGSRDMAETVLGTHSVCMAEGDMLADSWAVAMAAGRGCTAACLFDKCEPGRSTHPRYRAPSQMRVPADNQGCPEGHCLHDCGCHPGTEWPMALEVAYPAYGLAGHCHPAGSGRAAERRRNPQDYTAATEDSLVRRPGLVVAVVGDFVISAHHKVLGDAFEEGDQVARDSSM